MPFSDPTFWTGAGATGITGLLGVWIRRATRKESLEERLNRWQTETVQAVKAENADLREEVETLKEREGRLFIVETCLRLVVLEVMRLDPDSPVLRQVGAMLTNALPVDPELPDDMRELLVKIDAAAGKPKRRAK